MMAETVVDVTSTHNTARYANALIPMEAGVEQLAHKQQQQALQYNIIEYDRLMFSIFT